MLAKSRQEKERLLLAAKAQDILMQSAAKNGTPLIAGHLPKSDNQEVFEPEGEIDYTKYNKAQK